jgi:hypothetical protein
MQQQIAGVRGDEVARGIEVLVRWQGGFRTYGADRDAYARKVLATRSHQSQPTFICPSPSDAGTRLKKIFAPLSECPCVQRP